MKNTFKYSYFDLPGGAEETRMALLIGKIPFNDDRISMKDWPELKPKTPFGSLPVALIDDKQIVQSKAILRYVGKLTGLYPTDTFKALFVDQVVDTVVDFHHTFFKYSGEDRKLLQAARLSCMNEDAERFWGGLQNMICEISDGPFVLGDQLSIADLSIANIYLILRIGFLDFLPVQGLDGYSRMKAIFDNVCRIPEISEWQKKHPVPNM